MSIADYMSCSDTNNIDILVKLINDGFDINATYNRNFTPLEYAIDNYFAKKNDLEFIKTLLKYGAFADEPCNWLGPKYMYPIEYIEKLYSNKSNKDELVKLLQDSIVEDSIVEDSIVENKE
jgi:ankyrin repeat protein